MQCHCFTFVFLLLLKSSSTWRPQVEWFHFCLLLKKLSEKMMKACGKTKFRISIENFYFQAYLPINTMCGLLPSSVTSWISKEFTFSSLYDSFPITLVRLTVKDLSHLMHKSDYIGRFRGGLQAKIVSKYFRWIPLFLWKTGHLFGL